MLARSVALRATARSATVASAKRSASSNTPATAGPGGAVQKKSGPSPETLIVGGIGAVVAYYIGKSVLYPKKEDEEVKKA
ncbi:hypothetical protein Rhopal_001103-T1 [Rhodotorula paludigena]|uniref:Uncharacterized protein n=1 Tax=Rhodotorula paludigena TaxID=86838 RepID=A0AAV5G6G9_9BASI|nr:hypothetical protein Rhopal_001103-T1 [Rhodotorula paludigena]